MRESMEQFLARRRKLVRWWPPVGVAMLLVLVGFAGWLWFTQPLMVNPNEMARRLISGDIDDGTLVILAGMVPLLLWGCLIVTAGLVLLGFSVTAAERRYLAALDDKGGSGRTTA